MPKPLPVGAALIERSHCMSKVETWNAYLETRLGCYFQYPADLGSTVVADECKDTVCLGNIKAPVESRFHDSANHISK